MPFESHPFRTEELVNLVRDSYFLQRDPLAPTSRDIGVSRFGGMPDPPADIEWPKWMGKSLSFVAQINLGELPVIPERGLLPDRGKGL